MSIVNLNCFEKNKRAWGIFSFFSSTNVETKNVCPIAYNKAIKDTYKLSEKDSLMIENLKLDNELKKLQLQKTTTP